MMAANAVVSSAGLSAGTVTALSRGCSKTVRRGAEQLRSSCVAKPFFCTRRQSRARHLQQRRACAQRQRRTVVARSGGDNGSNDSEEQFDFASKLLAAEERKTNSTAVGLGIFAAAAAASYFIGEAAMMEGGDYTAAVLWGFSLYFVQPAQVILLFLAKTDTSRPSDFVLRQLGILAGEAVDDVSYEVPLALQLATCSLCFVSGIAIAAIVAVYFYDPIWGISTGVGNCLIAGVYELGRPRRLSSSEAQLLEAQWQEFSAWADAELVIKSNGSVHGTEIINKFRRARASMTEEVLSDVDIESMIKNWAEPRSGGAVKRTRVGYFKGLILKGSNEPQKDPLRAFR